MSAAEKISVIIPTLDEEDRIDACLDALRGQESPVEIIVVDGGSRDRTRELVRSRGGVHLVASGSAANRARQLNMGVRVASGEILWFVHADSLAPPGGARAIRVALEDDRVALGAFRFALTGRRRALRAVEWMVRFRSERFGLPYGDQGLFLRRATFETLGGFRDEPILEDLLLVHGARSLGRVRVLPEPMVTSSRRWEQYGVWRTMARNWSLIILERLGASPRWLAARRWSQAVCSAEERPAAVTDRPVLR